MKIKSIGQIARTVSDIEKSQAWYQETLGLTYLYTFGTMAFFDCDGVRLMLSQADAPLPSESIIYFSVNDIEAVAQALKDKGIAFVQEPQKIHQHDDGTQEWMGFINDLDGRPLGLMCSYSTE